MSKNCPKLPKIAKNCPKIDKKLAKIERLPQQLYFPHCVCSLVTLAGDDDGGAHQIMDKDECN